MDRYFRPLSGNYISQWLWLISCNEILRRVSVPCRGTTFLNEQMQHINDVYGTEFPSPVGELHFSMRYKIHKKSHLIVSVPCRGTTFLNKTLKAYGLSIEISVPCRGTTFLNHLNSLIVKERKISVPCRGTTFLNAYRTKMLHRLK